MKKKFFPRYGACWGPILPVNSRQTSIVQDGFLWAKADSAMSGADA